jgi:hypothetical protein
VLGAPLGSTLSGNGKVAADSGYSCGMAKYRFTEYFEKEVLRKRPYLKKEWCTRVVANPLRSEPQEHNRFRFWGEIPELEGRYLRVITLEDKVTIHNAFPERRFKP